MKQIMQQMYVENDVANISSKSINGVEIKSTSCTPPPAGSGSGLQGPHPRMAFSTALLHII